MKKVLVTGILGQDGANMAEFLLRQSEEIEVYGMMRRSANPNFINAQNFKDHPRFKFVFGDLSDDVSIDKLVNDIKPDYFINFAELRSCSCVLTSFYSSNLRLTTIFACNRLVLLDVMEFLFNV